MNRSKLARNLDCFSFISAFPSLLCNRGENTARTAYSYKPIDTLLKIFVLYKPASNKFLLHFLMSPPSITRNTASASLGGTWKCNYLVYTHVHVHACAVQLHRDGRAIVSTHI